MQVRAAGSHRDVTLRALAVATAVATYALVVLGSTVRVTESGMGCPGWPLCYGQLGPIDRFHALLEQSHRYLAAAVTIGVVATALIALRRRPRPVATRPALAGAGLIVVQIVLGAVTVFAHNAPPTVAAHLVTGLVLLSLVTVTAVAALAPHEEAPARGLGPLGWWATGGALLLLVSGSLVVDGGASATCPSWPGCPVAGVAGPLVALQLVHRGLGLAAGTAMLAFSVRAWRRWPATRGARPLAAATVALLAATGAIGAVTGLLRAPEVWQDAHLAAAAATLVAVGALASLGWLAGADGRPAVERPRGSGEGASASSAAR